MRAVSRRHIITGDLEVWLIQDGRPGFYCVAKGVEALSGITMEEYPEGSLLPEPTLRFSRDVARALVDVFTDIEADVAPENVAGLKGTLKATRAHLEDMRGQNKDLLAHVLGEKRGG